MRGGTPLWGVPHRSHRPPHRRLRARARVAEALASGRVRGDSERRARARSRRPPATASTGSSSPVARSRGRVCRSSCARGRRSTARTGLRLTVAGADPLAVRLLLTRLRVPDDGIDVVGFLSQDELTADAARREGARRAVDRAGELRHGADACVRVRAPGRRVGHPRLPGGARPRGVGRRRAGRSGGARRTRSCALVEDEPRREAMGEAARAIAVERYSWPGIARRLERDLRGRHGARERRGARGVTAIRDAWRSGWVQGAVRRSLLVVARGRRASGGAGPDWGSVFDAFRFVIWSWIVLAFLLNVVSTLFRALSWRLTIGQALPPEHQPRLDPRPLVVRRRPARECGRARAGSASSRASRPCAAIFPMRRPGRARRSSGPSSRTGSSTSFPRRSSSSGFSSRPRCRTGPSSRS